MSLTITSHFRSKMESTNPSSIIRKFTFNNSDLSSKVIQYPTITREVGDITGESLSFDIENASQSFNSLNTNRSQLLKTGIFEYGFSTESGTNDVVQLFGGELTKVNLWEGKGKLLFDNKLTKLKRRRAGSSQTPASYTSSAYNPADIVWWICTSYAGLSTTADSSNPDIDYTSWSAWKTILTNDAVLVHAHFEGDGILNILETVQRLTDSFIYSSGDNKIYFTRWFGASSYTVTLNDSYISGKVDYELYTDSILNKVTVQMSYNTEQSTWAGQVVQVNTVSVGSYGIFEAIYDDTNVWHINSVSAMNLAQRIIYRRGNANAVIKCKTPLRFLDIEFGDDIEFESQVYSISNKILSLKKYGINIETAIMTLEMDEGYGRGGGRWYGFRLDDNYNGLLDQSYNPLF